MINAMVRITPACAGSTAEGIVRDRHFEDHPRLRGEYDQKTDQKNDNSGSPPLARGVRRILACAESSYRITPACAGSTLKKA